MRVLSTAVALVVMGCGPLTPPKTDAGSGGGGGGGGGGVVTGGGGGGVSGGGGGGVTGGGGGGGVTGGGGGGGVTGGGGGGGATGGGGGGGGGTADPLPNYGSAAGTANQWTLTDQIPTGQRPYYYTAIRGLAADRLWVAGGFGDLWFFNGNQTWTLVYDDSGSSSLVFEDLAINSTGVVAVAGPERLLTCSTNCDQPGSFDGPPRANMWMKGLCTRGASIFAVGRDSGASQGVVFEYSNNAWSQVPLSPAMPALDSCHVLADGSLLLGGASLWHRSGAGAITEEVVSRPAFSLAPLVWTRFVESDDRVFVMGTFARIAQRRPDGSWKAVYEPANGGSGLFDAWPLGNQEILFTGDSPHTRLLLSGNTFTRLPDPVDFIAYGVWALDANTHWVTGARGTTSTAAFVVKAAR